MPGYESISVNFVSHWLDSSSNWTPDLAPALCQLGHRAQCCDQYRTHLWLLLSESCQLAACAASFRITPAIYARALIRIISPQPRQIFHLRLSPSSLPQTHSTCSVWTVAGAYRQWKLCYMWCITLYASIEIQKGLMIDITRYYSYYGTNDC